MLIEKNPLSYIRGVLDGDGYIDRGNTNPRICLMTTGHDNAEKFAQALQLIGLTPRITKRTRAHRWQKSKQSKLYIFTVNYIIVRATITNSLLQEIEQLIPCNDDGREAYIKGFFDSEGNILIQSKFHVYQVRMFNKNPKILFFVRDLLVQLNYKPHWYDSPNQSRIELALCTKLEFERFRQNIMERAE